jgi:spore coat polysaccharide biosynthesis predicted glycosyltransferase SpsG
LDKIIEDAKAKAFEAKGRTQALLDALTKTKSQSEANRLMQEFLKALNIAQDATFNYGQMAGRYEENARYMKECDELINAAGGEKALQVLMNVSPIQEIENVEKV